MRACKKRMWVLMGFAVSLCFANDNLLPIEKGVERSWLGPEYWANPMMDWQLKEGRLVCTHSGVNHDVQLTTAQLAAHDGSLSMKVRAGMDPQSRGEAFLGFKFSIKGHNPNDNRANWFVSKGIQAGVMPDGRLLLGKKRSESRIALSALSDLTLVLNVECVGNKAECTLTVFAGGQAASRPLASLAATLSKQKLLGNVAIACEVLNPKDVKKKRSRITGWFSDWRVSGSKLKHQKEQVVGPILWTQYSLSHGKLKLLTHLVPLSEETEHPVAFEIKNDDAWETLKTVHMDKLTRTALFEFDKWDATKDVEYRVVYKGSEGCAGCVSWSGQIRKEPLNRKDVALAVFTGLKDTAFPNSDLTATVQKHDPDIMFFSGDQIYEVNGGYRPVICRKESDLERATLNYLPKFWLWGLSFRELLKDRPSILTTDDHDVYSNDLWGRGGIPNNGVRNTGGYGSHPLWVNMVEHTQMGHMPKSPDPAPLSSGINVHYCHVLYGGLSLAVLEDRKFKSAPSQALKTPIGHTDMKNLESVKSSDFDPKDLDKPGLQLLGKRQENFLEQWADDWQGVEFKAVLSGSPFANVTHGYGDLVADLDGNGWPQTARNRALRIIQGANAVMAHGDLHIASLHQHGIDEFRDGPWSYCSPSSCATSLRIWTPSQPGQNRNPGAPEYTGDFLDGFGNKITIEAVLNPDHPFGQNYRKNDGSVLDHKYLRYSGFGILRFARPNHTVTFESWPIYDAETPIEKHQQHPGWPKTVTLPE